MNLNEAWIALKIAYIEEGDSDYSEILQNLRLTALETAITTNRFNREEYDQVLASVIENHLALMESA